MLSQWPRQQGRRDQCVPSCTSLCTCPKMLTNLTVGIPQTLTLDPDRPGRQVDGAAGG